ncbi:MAG TPA: CDP-alcohol phosphatidyltransferase family protein [Polyangiaceae bacterium]|nr:CDP-alcohol phosphatidyltransferase family protein [Polyangiaceae bacterium]
MNSRTAIFRMKPHRTMPVSEPALRPPKERNSGGVGEYRLHYLVQAPSLISWSRLLFAALFPWAASTPWSALLVLALAGASDVLDGWVARRYGLVTATGAVVDGITDKVFALVVVVTLLEQGRAPWASLALLGAREIGELPLVVWLAVSRAARHARTVNAKANVLGKAATVLQFVTVGAMLGGISRLGVLLGATALVGVLAAVSYWLRELGRD